MELGQLALGRREKREESGEMLGKRLLGRHSTRACCRFVWKGWTLFWYGIGMSLKRVGSDQKVTKSLPSSN